MLLSRVKDHLIHKLKIKLANRIQNRIPVGVIGLGDWGAQYIGILQESRELVPVVIFDQNKQQVDKLMNKGNLKVANSIEDMISYGIKAVFVISPNHTHESICRYFLERDINVYLEKPLSNELNSSKLILEIANESKGKLYVAHGMKMQPTFVELKNQLAAGNIGKVHYVYMNRSLANGLVEHDTWRENTKVCFERPLIQLGIHLIDTTRNLFGELRLCNTINRCDVTSCEATDINIVTLTSDNILFQMVSSYVSFSELRYIVYGERGKLEVQGDRLFLETQGKKKCLVRRNSNPSVEKREVKEFAKWIMDDIEPNNTVKNAYTNMTVIYAIIKQLNDNQ